MSEESSVSASVRRRIKKPDEEQSPQKNPSASDSAKPCEQPLQHNKPASENEVVTWFPRHNGKSWISYKVEVDALWVAMVVAGFVTRFWRLDFPSHVVFDEVHFGKFASYYLNGQFFFDVHPPLGKLLFALIGYLCGYDGSFLFPNIGVDFPPNVPYVMMRALSALAGSLLIPCVYQIMIEMGFSSRVALLAGIFTILDNSLVIQSRVIMLDSCVIFLTYLSILCYLKFYHCRNKAFSETWHKWLILTGVALGCLLGIKYTGLFGLAFIGILTLCDLWQLMGDIELALVDLSLHILLRGIYLLGIPVLFNISLFYIHLLLLTQSGPGDAFVSKAFRSSLQSTHTPHPQIETLPNSTLLRYGTHLTLRSVDLACWLHSHPHLYPLKYPDGRGSSYQQQVTCYEFKDSNNVWAVRRPGDPNNAAIGNDTSPIKNNDTIELVHVASNKLLNSHDVAAPLTPVNQEVAAYINYSAQFVPYLHWRLDVASSWPGDLIFWSPGQPLKLKLIHEQSKQALGSTGKRLPEWGAQQYEVATDRAVEGGHTTWHVDTITPPALSANSTEEEELKKALMEKYSLEEEKVDTEMLFWEKLIELQYHMVTAHGNLGSHQFGAVPQSWPLIGKTLPYWLDEKNNAQVTLIGNPLLWWFGSASLGVFPAMSAFYLLRRKRMVFDIPQADFMLWWTGGVLLGVGWLLHYAPYFLLSRVLFLHHYLPALPFKFMLMAVVMEHLLTWSRQVLNRRFALLLWYSYYVVTSFITLCCVISFIVFFPFTYGYPALTRDQILARQWKSTWDLLIRV